MPISIWVPVPCPVATISDVGRTATSTCSTPYAAMIARRLESMASTESPASDIAIPSWMSSSRSAATRASSVGVGVVIGCDRG